MNPAAPKTIQSVGKSGDSGGATGGTVGVGVTVLVLTATGVTGRVVTRVVASCITC